MLSILAAGAVAVALLWLAERFQSIVTTEEDAARAALTHEFEVHRIDEEALARGLSALNEAA